MERCAARGFDWTGQCTTTRCAGPFDLGHVKFIERERDGGLGGTSSRRLQTLRARGLFRACPTGSDRADRVGGVFTSPISERLRLRIVACPFGSSIGVRTMEGVQVPFATPAEGRLEPACAKVCPTQSIQFGDLDGVAHPCRRRLTELEARGIADARSTIRAIRASENARHLPRSRQGFRLQPAANPVVPTVLLRQAWSAAALASAAILGVTILAFLMNAGSTLAP